MSRCERCHGTSWILRPSADGRTRAVAERCPCTLELGARQRSGAARVPRHFAEATFEGFEAREVRLHEAKEACQRLVRRYPESRRGLVLMGPPGVGKTHLAAATLRGLLAKGADAIFYDFRDLLDELRSSYDAERAETEGAILERVFRADVLVLDEIGSEKLTDWVREIVHRIVIRRYNDERLTIFTTNYLDAEMLGREADPLETLEGRIGYRLRSRLYEMCDTVHLPGRDFRRQDGQLERARSVALAQARPEALEEDEALSLESCEQLFSKMPASEQRRYSDAAAKSFHTQMPPPAQVQRRAIELYREDIQRERA
jgi:DNA replication protein DnaC